MAPAAFSPGRSSGSAPGSSGASAAVVGPDGTRSGSAPRRSAFAVIFEHNMNTLQTHQLRLYAMIDLNFWL
jgi:hypothetical protein